MNSLYQINLAIAEDQPLFRKGLRYVLSSYSSFNILYECENGEVLMQALESSENRPDVCLLDIRMPVMDGYQTAKIIHLKYPEIKMIALSTHCSEFNIIKMLRSGASGYLAKDSHPDELFKAICSVYNGEHYISKGLSGVCKQITKNSSSLNKYHFSDKEIRFIELCCSELTYKQIADKMKVTLRTIDGYREHIFDKLETGCRTGIVLFAIKAGLFAVR